VVLADREDIKADILGLLLVSTATTLITTNDPVRIAEEYAMLQHLSHGRMDLMLGRGNTAPVYPWFGQGHPRGQPRDRRAGRVLRRRCLRQQRKLEPGPTRATVTRRLCTIR
jgi:alkanesulfonate monooxygenase SsuD/methylene tetrahydromethanopterin reductase-like flavin-dependent oxidoreductase (luciferase family)